MWYKIKLFVCQPLFSLSNLRAQYEICEITVRLVLCLLAYWLERWTCDSMQRWPVRISAVPPSDNNLGQVVYTHMPLSDCHQAV